MTENPMPDPSMLKLGAVALGGYVLGRLKKGKAAVGFAMWAAGVKADPKQLLRQGLINFASSAEGQQLLFPVARSDAGGRPQGSERDDRGPGCRPTAALQQRTSALTTAPRRAGRTGRRRGRRASGVWRR